MKREATIRVVLDFGDGPTPADDVLREAIESQIEGTTAWEGPWNRVARAHDSAVIDTAYVQLGEVVAP